MRPLQHALQLRGFPSSGDVLLSFFLFASRLHFLSFIIITREKEREGFLFFNFIHPWWSLLPVSLECCLHLWLSCVHKLDQRGAVFYLRRFNYSPRFCSVWFRSTYSSIKVVFQFSIIRKLCKRNEAKLTVKYSCRIYLKKLNIKRSELTEM